MYSLMLTQSQMREVQKELKNFQNNRNFSPAQLLVVHEMYCMMFLWRSLSFNMRMAEKKCNPSKFEEGKQWIKKVRAMRPGLTDMEYGNLIAIQFRYGGFKWVADPMSGKFDHVRSPEMIAVKKQDDCDGSAVLVQVVFPEVLTWCLWKYSGMQYLGGHIINTQEYSKGRFAIMSNFKYVGDAPTQRAAWIRGKSDATYAVKVDLINMRILNEIYTI